MGVCGRRRLAIGAATGAIPPSPGLTENISAPHPPGAWAMRARTKRGMNKKASPGEKLSSEARLKRKGGRTDIGISLYDAAFRKIAARIPHPPLHGHLPPGGRHKKEPVRKDWFFLLEITYQRVPYPERGDQLRPGTPAAARGPRCRWFRLRSYR